MAEKTAGGALAKRHTGVDEKDGAEVPGDGALPGEATHRRRGRHRGAMQAARRRPPKRGLRGVRRVMSEVPRTSLIKPSPRGYVGDYHHKIMGTTN
jgi:hypothetical protein